MPSARRFPPPWIGEEHNDACFIVKDATGQALGYFYFEEGARPALSGQPADPRRGPPAPTRPRSPSCRLAFAHSSASRTGVTLRKVIDAGFRTANALELALFGRWTDRARH